MSAAALIAKAHSTGVELRFEDGQIKYRGPRSAVAQLIEPLRQHKADLIRWFTSAPNDPVPADPKQWRELAAAYHDHHFGCRLCIAAGQGIGLRCGTGSALWSAYTVSTEDLSMNALNATDRNGKEKHHD